FEKNKLIFDLSSFDMKVTDQSLFASNRIMRNISQLQSDLDSLDQDKEQLMYDTYKDNRFFFTYLNESKLPLTPKLELYKQIQDSIDLVKKKADSLRLLENDSLKTFNDSIKVPLKDKYSIKSSVEKEKSKKKRAAIKNSLPFVTQDQIKSLTNAPRVIQGEVELIKNTNAKSKVDSTIINRQKRKRAKELKQQKNKLQKFLADSVLTTKILKSAVNTVRQNKSKLHSHNIAEERNRAEFRTFEVQWHKIIANSFACVVMFLIGAPLGAIIKRGGLGFPVLISILFFIIFYVFTMTGEKWAKQGVIDPMLGMWSSNILLFPIGLFFLRQARNDAKLFDADFYNVMILKIKDFISKKR
ncbi:MAG: LptF/LptG family permease, partial [Cyclobacteriaceae bacterium]|nr:LptF/LptG family permease [Cyclobacteriaceae bacterium]